MRYKNKRTGEVLTGNQIIVGIVGYLIVVTVFTAILLKIWYSI